MFTCTSLAMIHGCSIEKAEAAGLLHDCAKCIPSKKKLKLCEQHQIPVSDFEREHPFLLHSRLGALIAEKKYGIRDPEILSAITWHTTGKPAMSLLDKIVFIADYIEPMRSKAPRLEEIRKMAFIDLDECMYQILKDTLAYLNENPKDIDNTTKFAYDYYKKVHDERKKGNS